jgi:hypothetical protein
VRPVLLICLLTVPLRATAGERIPVAVLWLGDPAGETPERTVAELNAALAHGATSRPIDSAEDRSLLVTGGPSTRLDTLVRRAEAAYGKLDYNGAARDFEAAEKILLEEVPFSVERQRLAEVERGLLASYDQLGKSAQATRAVERLSFIPSAADDLKPLVDKYLASRAEFAPLPPIEVRSEPAGAKVYRNLSTAVTAPALVLGGDPAIDFIDLELPGYRRTHLALPSGLDGGPLAATLVKEDRLGVLVDEIRSKAPDAPPEQVAALGRRVGAARVLVLYPDGQAKLLGRFLDVSRQQWAAEGVRVDASGPQAMDRLVAYVSPPPELAKPTVVVVAPSEKKSRLGVWGKWYTWVAAGAVVALVVGLLVSEHVGDDKLTLSASH